MIPDLSRDQWRILALICRRDADALNTVDNIDAAKITAELRIIAVAIEEANP